MTDDGKPIPTFLQKGPTKDDEISDYHDNNHTKESSSTMAQSTAGEVLEPIGEAYAAYAAVADAMILSARQLYESIVKHTNTLLEDARRGIEEAGATAEAYKTEGRRVQAELDHYASLTKSVLHNCAEHMKLINQGPPNVE